MSGVIKRTINCDIRVIERTSQTVFNDSCIYIACIKSSYDAQLFLFTFAILRIGPTYKINL